MLLCIKREWVNKSSLLTCRVAARPTQYGVCTRNDVINYRIARVPQSEQLCPLRFEGFGRGATTTIMVVIKPRKKPAIPISW